MTSGLAAIVRDHKAGHSVGITSVCSAHPLVLEAAMRQACADETPVLIEATSNQVDQFGGYTGMNPAQFRRFCEERADRVGLPREALILGGDHLGPNAWQHLDARTAMGHAEDLVVAYVEAAYEKIHLDCSMRCADDPEVLTDTIVARRAARLLAAAERAADRVGRGGMTRYVVGTEVPVPGGAHEELVGLVPTAPEAARATIAAHRAEFAAAGLDACWPRVMALVVQPGVEFDHLKVVDFDPAAVTALKTVLNDEPTLVFEAHSTDYQRPAALAALVENHWAVLKVGPGLTFALREALFALERIEEELVTTAQRSRLRAVVDEEMVAAPGYWRSYYDGTPAEQALARAYSYSDRMRYYWPNPRIAAAQERLLANVASVAIPLPVLAQYLPLQYERVRDGALALDPKELVIDHVRDALRPYAAATRA